MFPVLIYHVSVVRSSGQGGRGRFDMGSFRLFIEEGGGSSPRNRDNVGMNQAGCI